MLNPASTETERFARECDCPIYVDRCVHVGARRIILTKNHCGLFIPFGIEVYDCPPLHTQPCCGAACWSPNDAVEWSAATTYAAALDVFYDAEARLLGEPS